MRGIKGGPTAARLAAVALIVWAAFGAEPALAQDRDQRATEPAQLENRIERRPAPPGEVEIGVPEAAPAEPAGVKKSFVLAGVVIRGATVYTVEELAALYEPYLATELTLADVKAIAGAITKKYRSDGYFLSRAIVPPQEIAFGILEIEVIEGYVETVTLKGRIAGRRGLLEAHAKHITEMRPLKLSVFERHVVLISDLPGVSVSAKLRRLDTPPGGHELILTFEHKMVEAEASIDNRGTRFLGRYVGSAQVTFNSLIGLYDLTRISAYTVPDTPDELLFFEAYHEQPIGSEGTTLALTGWYSRSQAGSTLKPDDIDSTDRRLALELWHPVIRLRDRWLYFTSQLEFHNTEQTEADVNVFKDRLRSLRVGARYLFPDGLDGTNLIGVEISQGLEILGASRSKAAILSRAGGRADYTKITADYWRRQPFADFWAVELNLTGQYTTDQLLSAEEFRLGGGLYGRAYDPSEVTGDNGLALSAELQHDLPLDPGPIKSIQLYVFYELGAAWDEAAAATSPRQSLSSAGGGVRWGMFGFLEGGFEIAQPLTRPVELEGKDGKDPRFFFNLSLRF